MTWFKVDDSLHSHVKAMRAGEAALGLWVLAGSWAADQLTDGWIPEYAALRLSPRASELAAVLVRAGLWVAEERDGEAGWVFHAWTEYQPTREDVETRRKADADRRARWRRSKKQGDETPVSERETDAESQGASRRDTHRDARGVSSLPDPTRPDPTKEEKKTSSSSARAHATRIPDDFEVTPEMVEWAREHTPLVGRAETDKFIDYWRAKSGQGATKRDWVATWRNWMRRAQEDSDRRGSRPAGRMSKDDRINALDAFLVPEGEDNEPTVLRALPGGAA